MYQNLKSKVGIVVAKNQVFGFLCLAVSVIGRERIVYS